MHMTRINRGFSLIELMVALTLLGLLLSMGIPAFGTWTANARVRSSAESIQNAVRLAQTEAVRRNRQTIFALTNATPASGATPVANGTNWFIQTFPLPGEAAEFIQGGTFAKQSAVTVTAANPLICFNSTGRQVANTATGLGVDCTAAASSFVVTKPGSADRRLQVQVALGGQIRMCDPDKFIATQPDGC